MNKQLLKMIFAVGLICLFTLNFSNVTGQSSGKIIERTLKHIGKSATVNGLMLMKC